MRSPKKKGKAVSPAVAILVIVVVLALAIIIGMQVMKPKAVQGVMSREASLAAGSRYKYAMDRWKKEVELAKKEGRAPDARRYQPRPTGAMAPGGRPEGFENMGAGSLATRPGEASGPQSSGGPGGPPGSGTAPR